MLLEAGGGPEHLLNPHPRASMDSQLPPEWAGIRLSEGMDHADISRHPVPGQPGQANGLEEVESGYWIDQDGHIDLEGEGDQSLGQLRHPPATAIGIPYHREFLWPAGVDQPGGILCLGPPRAEEEHGLATAVVGSVEVVVNEGWPRAWKNALAVSGDHDGGEFYGHPGLSGG